MEEIWRNVKGYEGIYRVSDQGRIFRIGQLLPRKNGVLAWHPGGFLKPRMNSCGYLRVQLCRRGKPELKLVHRLVAEAFLGESNGLPQVNHKNENKQDNRAENLEWCDVSYNCSYGSKPESTKKAHGKMVRQFSMDGRELAVFNSTREAEQVTGSRQSHISSVCRGVRKSAGGFKWEYVESSKQ